MLYLHLFSSFFHFRLYSTYQISDIAVPRFLFMNLPYRSRVAIYITCCYEKDAVGNVPAIVRMQREPGAIGKTR